MVRLLYLRSYDDEILKLASWTYSFYLNMSYNRTMADYYNEKIESIREKNESKSGSVPHYYGDIVRRLFLIAAVLMLITMPFFKDWIFFPTHISVLAVVILALASGFTAPRQTWVYALDLIVSVIGVLVFGFIAVEKSGVYPLNFIMDNLVLAVLFLVALYFSAKTIRGAPKQ